MIPRSGAQIDSQLVDALFSHPDFRAKLDEAIYSCRGQTQFIRSKPNNQLTTLIQEISQLLFNNYQYSITSLTRQIKLQIANLHLEVEKLKDSIPFMTGKIENVSRQIFEESPEEDQQLYDLPSIKRTIHFLQEKIKEISPNTSTVLESNDISKDNKSLEDYFQSKLSHVFEQAQHNLTAKYQAHEENMNMRLEKQQKTINSILDTLNDINGSALTEKTPNTLTNSKSSTKLKNFFGFR